MTASTANSQVTILLVTRFSSREKPAEIFVCSNLKIQAAKPNDRLSCQIKAAAARDGLVVKVPERRV